MNEFKPRNGLIIPTETASTVPYLDANKKLVSSDVTPTELDYLDGVSSNIQTQLDGKTSSASPTFTGTVTTPVTASRALVTGASSELAASATTATELGYVNGVTGAIQTQLDAKQLRSTLTTKGDLYVATASATVARQGIGTDSHVLVADSNQTNGLKWAAPASNYDGITNLTLTASLAANAITIDMKTQAGSDATAADPIKISFLSNTVTSATYNHRSVTGALSVTISSGSTLNTVSAKPARIYIYAIDNAGTVELAVSQVLYRETAIITTVAEGGAGAADSTSMYSTTARTGVSYRLLAYFDSTQATAGAWATALTTFRLCDYATATSFMVIGVYGATTPTGTLTSAYNTTTFGTTIRETHTMYSGGEISIPISGSYNLQAQVRQDATYAAGNTAAIAVFIDGVQKQTGLVNAGGVQTSCWPSVVTFGLQLLAGQVVTIRSYNNATSPAFVSSVNQNNFSIMKIGEYNT